MGVDEDTTVHDFGRSTIEVEEFKHGADHIEEVTIARLTEEDINTLSKRSLNFNSWTGFRLCVVMFIQVGITLLSTTPRI